MGLYTVLIFGCMATLALAGPQCSGNGRMVRQFNGRKEDTKMPCKYHAVRQECGAYIINLTPGNVYLYPKYRLDSLWLGIKVRGGTGYWLGRTDNKLAVKYINGWIDFPFETKSTNLNTRGLLKVGVTDNATWVESYNKNFKVTFLPWDPADQQSHTARWTFECRLMMSPLSGYSRQICGGDEKRETVHRYKKLGLKRRDQAIYYDVFTNTALTQTNPKCAEATRLMTTVCTEEQRREAIITCSQILSSYRHTKCVSKHTCDPTDVFVDCIDWVCSDFKKAVACKRIGEAIDTCRYFKQGNLTARVQEAKCYKDFLPIEA